jgi:PD-(D/E)XK nuclease superfamily
MSDAQLADPALAVSAAGLTAAQLAARIEIPRRLPPRYDGQPLLHLSHSSVTKFWLCPESWRRYYICGERHPPTGSMFLGSRVDDAITLYYRRILEHGERLSVDQIKDAFWDDWKAAAEREQLGIAWEDEMSEDRAVKLGLDAIDLSFRELVPRLGEPVAAQRKLEYVLAPGLEWSVQCYLDLETRRADHGEQVAGVVDYKVKSTPVTEYKAGSDFQPSVYLAGRWLEGAPAGEFCFAQIAKPGPRRKEMSASVVTTRRSTAQLRGALARIGQVASQIAACHERYGPERPWGFADPTGWKCSRRYCEAWANCPGGGGL